MKPTVRLDKIRFSVILDPRQEIFSKYHREMALPYSVLVNSSGEIQEVFEGLHEEEMIPRIKSLLGTKVANASK